MQHANRALYQASIWTTCLEAQQDHPTPEGFGWTRPASGVWKPVWTLLPEVAKACQELLKCGCKSQPLCTRRCKYKDAGLPCTSASVADYVILNINFIFKNLIFAICSL